MACISIATTANWHDYKARASHSDAGARTHRAIGREKREERVAAASGPTSVLDRSTLAQACYSIGLY